MARFWRKVDTLSTHSSSLPPKELQSPHPPSLPQTKDPTGSGMEGERLCDHLPCLWLGFVGFGPQAFVYLACSSHLLGSWQSELSGCVRSPG